MTFSVLSATLPRFEPGIHERLRASLLWDRLYPDLDDLAVALMASDPRAVGRLVEVYGHVPGFLSRPRFKPPAPAAPRSCSTEPFNPSRNSHRRRRELRRRYGLRRGQSMGIPMERRTPRSTCSRSLLDSCPPRAFSLRRSFESVVICSHLRTQSTRMPPSPFRNRTCVGAPR